MNSSVGRRSTYGLGHIVDARRERGEAGTPGVTYKTAVGLPLEIVPEQDPYRSRRGRLNVPVGKGRWRLHTIHMERASGDVDWECLWTTLSMCRRPAGNCRAGAG